MSENSIDFNLLIEKIGQAQVTNNERPMILGGQFAVERLEEFLQSWQRQCNQMPFRMWEHISHIEFADTYSEPQFLQRAEIFGESGHLSLRRDGERWLWHYIGNSDMLFQGSDMLFQGFEYIDFWQDHPNCMLRRYADSVILWGEYQASQQNWYEERVAAATLVYPLQSASRVYLHFWRYTEHGQTVFVQYRTLSNNPL